MTPTAWTIKALLDWMTPYLDEKGVDAPRLCAEMLLGHVLQKPRLALYTEFDRVVGPDDLACLRELVKRAADHEPVAYLVGRTEFYSMTFEVSPACLIPRPETELLVQYAVETLKDRDEPSTVLDLGTGSGCIGLAIARHVPTCHVVATDIREEALAVARRNGARHGLGERVTWRQGDLWDAVAPEERFDVIVSNPPYVGEAEYAGLDKNVRDYEPVTALVAGADGLAVIRRLVPQTAAHLNPSGHLLLEIGAGQAAAVRELVEQTGHFADIAIHRDFQRIERVVDATRI